MTTVKEYLSEAKRIDEIVETYKEELLRIGSGVFNVTAFYGERTSGARRDRGDMIISYQSRRAEYEWMIEELLKLRSIIVESIALVPDEQQRGIIDKRYNQHMPWKDIASGTYMTREWTHALSKRGISQMTIPEEYSVVKSALWRDINMKHMPIKKILEHFFLYSVIGHE